jgi:hypothetical protein
MGPGSRKSSLWCRAARAVFLVLALALVGGAPAAVADPLAGSVGKVAGGTGSAVQKVEQADAQLTRAPSKTVAAAQAPVAQPTPPRQAVSAPSAPVHAAGSIAATAVRQAPSAPSLPAPVTGAPKAPAAPITQVAHTVAGAIAPVTHAASKAAAVTPPAAKITTQVTHTAIAVTAPLSAALGAATTKAAPHPAIPAPLSGAVAQATSSMGKALSTRSSGGAIANARSLVGGVAFGRSSGGGPTATAGSGGPFAGAGPSALAPSSLGGPATADLAGAKAADRGHPTGGVLALVESALGSRSSWLAGLAPISSLPLLLGGPQMSHKGGRGGSQGSPLPSTPLPAPGPLGGVSPASAAALGFGLLMLIGLAGLLVLVAPFAARRLRLAGESLGASAFVLIPERPG